MKNVFRKRFHTPTIQSLLENAFRNTLTSFIFVNKTINIYSHILMRCMKQLPLPIIIFGLYCKSELGLPFILTKSMIFIYFLLLFHCMKATETNLYILTNYTYITKFIGDKREKQCRDQ